MTGNARSRAALVSIVGLALISICLATGMATAGQTAHAHGSGSLLIVEEDGHVEMELVVSGADVVGFEHMPATPAERDAVGRAMERLADAAALFAFPGDAECETVSTEVQSSLSGDDAQDAQHADDHGEKHRDTEDRHADFRAHYVVRCANPRALNHVDVLAFQHFPAIARLNVQAATMSGQRAADLTTGSNRFTF